jgi:hypothetical protein
MATKTRRDLEDTIIKKSLQDEAFRSALLADAKSAVESALSEEAPGAKLPAGLEVKAIQEPANALYIVVPSVPELSDTELEQAAGGWDWEGSLQVKVSNPKPKEPPKKETMGS